MTQDVLDDLAPDHVIVATGAVERMPALEIADDALVLGWVALTLVQETEAFLAWEQAVPSHVVR